MMLYLNVFCRPWCGVPAVMQLKKRAHYFDLWIAGLVFVCAMSPVRAVDIAPGTLASAITQDSTLLAGQTYQVSGDVTVNSGITLTIQAGARVEFDSGTRLTVNGVLSVLGGVSNKVTFTSSLASPAKGSWYGIVIGPGATGVVIDHAIIEWANRGIYFDQTDGAVHHSVIQNNSFGIYVGYGASPQVTQSNAIINNTYGVYVRGNGNASQNPNPMVTSNSLYGNSNYDYYAYYFGNAASVTLDASNNWWGTMDILAMASKIYDNAEQPYWSPMINFLPFQGSEGGASTNGSGLSGAWDGTPLVNGQVYDVVDDFTVPQGSTLTIPSGVTFRVYGANTEIRINGSLNIQGTAAEPVIFTSNKTNPAKNSWSGLVIGPDATNVLIDYAVIEWASRGIAFDQSTGAVHHSVIQNNMHGIYVGYGASPQITQGNTITGNTYGVYVAGSGNASQNPNPVVTSNSLYGNSNYDYYAYYLGNAASVTLDASNNWWGTTDILAIAAKIYDNAEQSVWSPMVNFLPFQGSEGGASINGSGLSGAWDGTPLVSGQVYDVVDDFTVPQGSTLTIPAGTTFRVYGANTEIRIDGSLNIQGTAAEPVIFTSNKTNPAKNSWSGLVIGPDATNVLIDYAVIEWANRGIFFDQTDGAVHHSVIQNNSFGIYVGYGASPQITQGNTITNNTYGVYVRSNGNASQNPNPVVTSNSLYGNSNYDYYAYYLGNAASVTLDASNNWWGTTDILAIAAKIYDNAEQSVWSPMVNFLPFQGSEGGASTNGSGLSGAWDGTPLVSGQVYDVIDDFTVPQGSALTIPAGTTFRVYGANTEIRINGSLNIQGTAAEPVIFTSNKTNPAKNSWSGLVIGPNATNVVIDYATIEWANRGIFFDQSTGAVHHSVIQNNSFGIYVGYGASPQITQGNTITNNTYGVYVRGNGNASQNPSPVVTGNSLYGNSNYDYYAYYLGNAASVTLDASNNWWGTTDVLAIATNIYDNAEQSVWSPVVGISPIRQSPPSPEQINYIVLNNVTLNQGAATFDSTLQGYFTLNSVSNPAGETVKGASRLVVSSSSLTVTNADGYTGNNEPFFIISASASFDLATGDTTPDMRIEFENVSTGLVYTLRFEVVDTDADTISDAYEAQVGTNPDDLTSMPQDLNSDGIPDVINNLVGTWHGPCRDLGGGEFAQDELVFTYRDVQRKTHTAHSADCQARWLTVNNAYTYSMSNIGNIATTGVEFDLKLDHVYVTPHELAVNESLNQFCTKQDFAVAVQNIADGVQCQGDVIYPNAGVIHYDRLKNNVSIQLGNKLDVINAVQRATEVDSASFNRTAQ